MKSIKPLQSNSARHSGTTVILIHNCVTFVYAFHMIRLPMNMRSIVDIIWLEQIYQNVYEYYAHSSEFINYYHTMSGGLVLVCTLFMYAIRKPIINYYFNKLRFHSVRVNMFLWWSMSNQANVYIQQRRRRKKTNQQTLTVQNVRLLQFVRVKHWSYLEIEKLVRFCLIFPLTFTSVDVLFVFFFLSHLEEHNLLLRFVEPIYKFFFFLD